MFAFLQLATRTEVDFSILFISFRPVCTMCTTPYIKIELNDLQRTVIASDFVDRLRHFIRCFGEFHDKVGQLGLADSVAVR